MNWHRFLLLPLLILSTFLWGQSETTAAGFIKGYVVDSITGAPLPYVSVAVQHVKFNKILNGAMTDEKGVFKIDGLAPGSYRLRFSYVGYNAKVVTGAEITPDKIECKMGKIALQSASTLKEVTINAGKTVVENQVDRIVYNVDRDPAASTQSLPDVLRKVPMVQVDAEGNVSLRGSQNIQVLINGKPSGMFARNISDALRTIPADQVARVEVITMPSARYDAEGTAGIINIVTQKKQLEGMNGSINVGLGNLYNNTSSNINLRGEKIGVNAMLSGNGVLPMEVKSSITRTETGAGYRSDLNQSGIATMTKLAGSGALGMDYDPNARNSFSSIVRFSKNQTQMNGSGMVDLTMYNSESTQTLQTNRQIQNVRANQSVEWTTDYRRNFNNPKNQLNASVQWSHNPNNTAYQLLETNAKIPELDFLENALNYGGFNETTVQTDFSCEPGKKTKLETGAKYILRNLSSDYNYFRSLAGYEPVAANRYHDALRSNSFGYQQSVTAAFAEATYALRTGVSLRSGLRGEFTDAGGQAGSQQLFERNYFNLVPNLALSVNLKKNARLNLSYSRRIQRPGFDQLNPYVNGLDPLNPVFGNPDLTPEIVDLGNFDLYLPFEKVELDVSMFFMKGTSNIERLTLSDQYGSFFTSYYNAGQSQRVGGNVYGSWKIQPNWTLRGFYFVSYFNASNGTGLNNYGWQQGVQAFSSVEIKKRMTLEIAGAYFTPGINTQETLKISYSLQAAARFKVLKDKGSLSLSLSNPFNPYARLTSSIEMPDYSQYKTANYQNRALSLGFNYRFGKNNLPGKMAKKKTIKNDDIKKEESNPY